MIDIHSHIIHGIDDGAKTLEDTMTMLRMAYEDGIKSIIATPHYRAGKNSYDIEVLENQYQLLLTEIKQENLMMNVFLGHEAYLDEFLLEALLKGKCKTLGGSRYVLIEVYNNAPMQMIKKILFDILLKNYIPIIAHCERLIKKREDCRTVLDLKAMGCLLQVNASTLLETKNRWLQRWLIKRLKDGTISFVATDAHDTCFRTPTLSIAYKKIRSKAGSEIANNVTIINPEKIIFGGHIT